MYFSPGFLQNSLYIVAILLIITTTLVFIYKVKHGIGPFDRLFALSVIMLINILYSILQGFINLPYMLSTIITGGLSLIAFGYVVIILVDLYKQRSTKTK
ncbi:hypothetical protein M5C72_09700 [Companilactobacillus allii]|uniref:Uncharacterized protein n=1 Tax=Companilactobacillus allii TaxID=1847728 RepID=A0A1P8PZJ4_9LACO|nr:hypothetical protein [Companilactobacillus allii]APX71040.1 hypothetical protein BTM29_00075 [Companilactobacillus allii]USQ68118.1 hypothetical protein M5C72_09700 [Companilactobacillus allii]